MLLRSVLRALSPVLLVAVGMMGTSIPVCVAAAVPSAEAGRTSVDLAKGWRFHFGGDAKGVTENAYDDHGWEAVDLPHTWNRIGEYGTTRSSGINDSHGIGWYRLRFATPPHVAGRRQFLQFDAVGNIADVWINGAPLGRHAGAFSRFRFDVTDRLRPGADNVIVVRADNSKPEVGATTENVIPLAGDFFVHGGIYRGVSLVDAAETQIDLLDHGGPGVYVSTPSVAADRADVSALVRLRNFGARDRALSLVTSVVDAEGRVVVSDSAALKLAKTSTSATTRVLALMNPHLWRGRKDPYLYGLVVELRDGGKVVDRVTQSFGVRTFRFDANSGFVLNGEPTPLHGASRHQDRLGEGWALTPADHAQDMAIMAEMGVNTIRHAHYQHAQEWVDAADRAGMIVWAEVPFVHESSLTNDAPSAALIDNARSQLTELIRQNYNHPSVVIWSIGNEVDIRPTQIGTDKPAQSLVVLQSLNALAKQEDPSRATAYADCCEDAQALKGSQVLSNVADITGYNRYFGWYYGQPGQLGPALDRFHARYPAMPVAVSEYGAGGATSQHTDNPQGGPVNIYGRPHPEEYESWVHEESWKVLEARRYLAAVWIWNMFDFSSDLREEGDATFVNDKGMVTSDRKTKKDVFYFYKAQWSSEPVLHISGRRYRRSRLCRRRRARLQQCRSRVAFRQRRGARRDCLSGTNLRLARGRAAQRPQRGASHRERRRQKRLRRSAVASARRRARHAHRSRHDDRNDDGRRRAFRFRQFLRRRCGEVAQPVRQARRSQDTESRQRRQWTGRVRRLSRRRVPLRDPAARWQMAGDLVFRRARCSGGGVAVVRRERGRQNRVDAFQSRSRGRRRAEGGRAPLRRGIAARASRSRLQTRRRPGDRLGDRRRAEVNHRFAARDDQVTRRYDFAPRRSIVCS